MRALRAFLNASGNRFRLRGNASPQHVSLVPNARLARFYSASRFNVRRHKNNPIALATTNKKPHEKAKGSTIASCTIISVAQ